MSEHKLQYNIVELLNYYKIMFIQTDVMGGLAYFSHTDGRRYAFIAHHKKMGYRKGQPDLVLILPKETVYVEVKDKGKQTPEQLDFQREVEARGQRYLVWDSIEKAQRFLDENT